MNDGCSGVCAVELVYMYMLVYDKGLSVYSHNTISYIFIL
jgi:hypothetical protein